MRKPRTGMLLALAALGLAGWCQAQNAPIGPGPGIPAAPTAPPPKPIIGYTGPAPTSAADLAKKGLLQRWFENCANNSCQTHHNDYGCGSWKADTVFIFGSCRAFWGDPCYKGPPRAYENWPGIFKP